MKLKPLLLSVAMVFAAPAMAEDCHRAMSEQDRFDGWLYGIFALVGALTVPLALLGFALLGRLLGG